MSLLPVIVRELRSQSRQPFTYWLRLVGALTVLGAVVLTLWSMGIFRDRELPNTSQSTAAAFGTTLFGKINLLIFAAIWLFVPLATADAISRERREGTLPLLYLTELRSFGIVVGKAFVHMLRSASLFLAVAPWLLLPLVFGGVSGHDVTMALTLDFSSVLLAQGAGLLASAFPRDWLKSAILSLAFSFLLFLLLLNVHGWLLNRAAAIGTSSKFTQLAVFWSSPLRDFYNRPDPGTISHCYRLVELLCNESFNETYGFLGNSSLVHVHATWAELWTALNRVGRSFWLRGIVFILLGSALLLSAATWLAAWRVERSWREASAPLLNPELRQKLFSPRFAVHSLRHRLSRSLTANPIGWLQHYSPQGRIVKWAWCLVIIVVETLLTLNITDLYEAQASLGLLLLLGLTFSSIGSFRQELETGAFELLLVTPLRERQIIVGRLRGLWRQFLPAIVIYGAGSIYLASGWSDRSLASDAWHNLARVIAGFCALPLIGLYFSVRRWNFFAAWLAASTLGFIPVVFARAYGLTDAIAIPIQVTIALTAAALLYYRLKSRRFLQRVI